MSLTAIDWIIMAVYSVFVLGIGVALKRYMVILGRRAGAIRQDSESSTGSSGCPAGEKK